MLRRPKPHLRRATCPVPRGARRSRAGSPWRRARCCRASPPAAAPAPPLDQARPRPHRPPPPPRAAPRRPDRAEEGTAAPPALLRSQLRCNVCPAQGCPVEPVAPGMGVSYGRGCPGGRRSRPAAPRARGRCCRRASPRRRWRAPQLLPAAPLCWWRPPCWQPSCPSG